MDRAEDYRPPVFVKSDITLTVGILVSNNIKYIRKCLESLKPLLAAVPSELIVIDTMGPEKSDGSLDVAKEYTDKVFHFDWINDFSAARNAALERACGEWFMYLDDDEYFDDVSEFIEFFNSTERDNYYHGLYYTGDYVTKDEYQKNVADRIARRTESLRFEGIIHERFNENYSPVKLFNAMTRHFGYLYETPEKRRAKQERNLALLEKELERGKPDARIYCQIVGQFMGVDNEEASKRCTEYIRRMEGTEEFDTTCGQWLLVTKARFMADWGSLPGLLDIEKKLLGEYSLAEIPRLALNYLVADLAYERGDYETAADRADKYFALLDWADRHPEEKALQMQMDFPNYLIDKQLFNMCKISIASENQQGRFILAVSRFWRLDFDFCTDFQEIRSLLEETLRGLGDAQMTIDYYKHFYRDEFFEAPLCRYLPEAVRKQMKEAE